MDTASAIVTFLKSRQAKGLSKRTIDWYRVILERFSYSFPDLPDNPGAIEDFLIQCRAGDERRHGYYRTVRAFYRFLTRRYDMKNIVNMVDAPKRLKKKPRPLTLDELDQLISYPHPLRISAAIMFMADTGARVGETAELDPSDLLISDWGSVARINGKTGERVVPISEATYHKLLQVLPFRIKSAQLSRLVSWAFRDAHVKGSAHSLRHTFGTYWDGDDTVLKEIMGHSNISTTELYKGLRLRKMCEQQHEYSPLKAIVSNRQLSFFPR
ncbi:MAG: tyrosine-type recombinase/integrase [Candidatus Omnitrophota bacterium]|jgi:integrase